MVRITLFWDEFRTSIVGEYTTFENKIIDIRKI